MDHFDNEISNGKEKVNLREILNKYLYHWPVFFFGVLLACVGTFIYLRYTQPVYEVSSTLLIKDQKKGGGPTEDMMSQLDLFGGVKVVDNEIEILQSKALMRKVVERLNLDAVYESEGRVITTDVYETRPVTFVSLDINEELYGQPLMLSFPDEDHYLLEEEKAGLKLRGELNQLQRNTLGAYKINKTSIFKSHKKGAYKLVLMDPVQVTDNCLSQLSVNLATKQSTVLKLSFIATVPQRGKDILNTLIQVYNEASLTDKNKTTQSTIDFIDDRLKLISGELTAVEKNVETFKSSQGLTDMSSDANLYLDNVKGNDAKLNEVELQISVMKDVQRYVNSDSPQEKLPSTLGINDPVLLGQISQLSDLQLKRDQLLSTTQSNNPLVQPLTKQIETTRAGIKSNIENIISALSNTKKELEANSSQYQGYIKKIPTQERQFIGIKRQQTIKESLYLYLLQKKEEAALSYASAVADSRVVDAAYTIKTPISPKRRLTYMVALMFGFILPIGYVYTKDLLNNKILKTSDITELTKAPLLGEIMYDGGSEPIVVQANSRKAIAEQFRAIRTNLQYLNGRKEKGRVTLFTSSMSGEGKSFVTSNIGAALAISGRKTVLLELDLRKPKVSKYLNLRNNVGLSNYLIGKASIANIIQPSGINENLFVIGSGPVPPNPSELLIQPEIEDLMDYLKENFDEILIDTPPIGLVTDAQILSKLADATLYIVRHGITFKEQIEQLDKLYLKDKFPKLNIILNGVQLGGRYGGYGYGYGYGYYSDDDDLKEQNVLGRIFKDFFKRF